MRRLLVCATAVLAMLLASIAHAQDAPDVEIELVQFGVGSAYRPGDVAAIRLNLTSNIPDATQVWVQWEVSNVDGDLGEYGRSIALTQGPARPVWLYAPIKPRPSAVWRIRVFEEEDGNRGRELHGIKIDPSIASVGPGVEVPGINGMIAVIGRQRMMLDGYQWVNAAAGMDRPHGAHETTRVFANLSIQDCPDRWYGWSPFEAVVWGSYDQTEPTLLTGTNADALREYVQRGGHLVIMLPYGRSPWGIGSQQNARTEFGDLLPSRAPASDEEVPLSDMISIMAKSTQVVSSNTFPIYYFKDLSADGTFDAIDNHYEPVMTLDDGRVVVIQRTYGHGRITISGIDASSGTLRSIRFRHGTDGLPQTDVFWNRILGRRADIPTSTEITAIEQKQRLARRIGGQPNLLGRGGLITQQIPMAQQAALGLMVALVLFAIYWLAAGPGGFFFLKQYKMVRHSWLGFAAAAGIFTAIAWGTVALLPNVTHDVVHVTFLDHIARPGADTSRADPQLHRATSYFSVYLDDYRPTRVRIDSPPTDRNLLLSLTAPGDDESTFPNIDSYKVDIDRNAADYMFPARSTATRAKAQWLGSVDPTWGTMLREDPNNPIRVVDDATAMLGNQSLRGSIVHGFPTNLTDVSILWVTNYRYPTRRYQTSGNVTQPWVPPLDSGRMFNRGFMWRLPGPLAPNQALSLTTAINRYSRQDLIEDGFYKLYSQPYVDRSLLSTNAIGRTDQRNYMEMLTFFHQMEPPAYVADRDNGNAKASAVLSREIGRELDLSAWLHRPCIIVIGYLENSEIPIPLRIGNDDDPPSSNGRTMVRWVYPLPLDEANTAPGGLKAEADESE